MANDIWSKFENSKKEHSYVDGSLGARLKIIADLYLQEYPQPQYFGPFLFHTNQVHAKILQEMGNETDERALLALIATLYSLPKTGVLSLMLLNCISNYNFDSKNTYETIINSVHDQQCYSGSASNFNSSMADVLSYIHKYKSEIIAVNDKILRAKKQAPGLNVDLVDYKYPQDIDTPVAVNSTKQTLAHSLAKIGEKYLQAHPKPSSTLFFFNRHNHQNQAKLLLQLDGKSDKYALEIALQLLSGIKSGELTSNIMSVLDTQYRPVILSRIDTVEKYSSREHQYCSILTDEIIPTLSNNSQIRSNKS